MREGGGAASKFKLDELASALGDRRSTSQQLSNGNVALSFSLHDPVAVVQLRNPSRRNALSCTMMHDLDIVVDLLETQFQGTCVILTGEGGSAHPQEAFCAGADLRSVESNLSSADAGAMMSEYMHFVLGRWQGLPQITIAAINGPAVGGGAELITACDHRIADTRAAIQFVHPTMGISPGWGGGTRLTKLVGRSRALRLLASAEKVTAEAALELGLVDALAGGEGLSECSTTPVNGVSPSLHAALEYAASYIHVDCLNFGQNAVRGIKQVVHAADCDHGELTFTGNLAAEAEELLRCGHGGRTDSKLCVEATGDGGDEGKRQGLGGVTTRAMHRERGVFSSLWGADENQFALARKLKKR